ncbi:Retinal-binding protein [Orchesella cincta]|uniref:Retinal-binding protein n=1 Tax=Orchesella cincta TaxID=48709 RepID=A0A1D2MEF7_ORCCI|nr:Retinal-binding protein [Orchesella cincta]
MNYFRGRGSWDLRAAAFSGHSTQLIRYIESIMEDAATTIRKFQSEGKNVSQFDYIVNMENYNVVQQGCRQCLPFYVTLVNSAESHYPNLANKIWLINTPPIFQVVLRLLRPLMSPVTQEVVKVFGQDKVKWKKALIEIADKSQLRPEYGGTFMQDKE